MDHLLSCDILNDTCTGRDLVEANDVVLTFATLFGHINNRVMIQIDNDDDIMFQNIYSHNVY